MDLRDVSQKDVWDDICLGQTLFSDLIDAVLETPVDIIMSEPQPRLIIVVSGAMGSCLLMLVCPFKLLRLRLRSRLGERRSPLVALVAQGKLSVAGRTVDMFPLSFPLEHWHGELDRMVQFLRSMLEFHYAGNC